MEINTTQEILLFRIMMCDIVLFFSATYVIALFIYWLFFVSNICRDHFRTLYVWNGKIVFLGGCTSGCCFTCNIMFCSYHYIPCLILTILSWSTTLHWNIHDCWTCFQEELCLPLVILLYFCLFFSLFCIPNPSWVGGHMIWCIHIDETLNN